MFRRVLIANRAEVGARILSMREARIETVATASTADREHSWLEANRVVVIGARPAEST